MLVVSFADVSRARQSADHWHLRLDGRSRKDRCATSNNLVSVAAGRPNGGFVVFQSRD